IDAVRRIRNFSDRLKSERGGTPELGNAADELLRSAEAALFDDLNAPEAIAALSVFITRGNAELDRGGHDVGALAKARSAFERINGVLDIVPDDAQADAALAGWIEERLGARRAARAARDFAAADRIRGELSERGVLIEDTAGGTKWRLAR